MKQLTVILAAVVFMLPTAASTSSFIAERVQPDGECTDDTGLAFAPACALALSSGGSNRSDMRQWIITHQRPDGTWGLDSDGGDPNTVLTAMAILSLVDHSPGREACLRGVLALESGQNVDGGWGAVVGGPTDPAATVWATYALALLGPDRPEGAVSKALKYYEAALSSMDPANTTGEDVRGLLPAAAMASADSSWDSASQAFVALAHELQRPDGSFGSRTTDALILIGLKLSGESMGEAATALEQRFERERNADGGWGWSANGSSLPETALVEYALSFDAAYARELAQRTEQPSPTPPQSTPGVERPATTPAAPTISSSGEETPALTTLALLVVMTALALVRPRARDYRRR